MSARRCGHAAAKSGLGRCGQRVEQHHPGGGPRPPEDGLRRVGEVVQGRRPGVLSAFAPNRERADDFAPVAHSSARTDSDEHNVSKPPAATFRRHEPDSARALGWLLMAPTLAMLAANSIFPLIYAVTVSFKNYQIADPGSRTAGSG